MNSYCQITIEGIDFELRYPIGTINDKFESVIYNEEIESEDVKGNPTLFKPFQKTTPNKASHSSSINQKNSDSSPTFKYRLHCVNWLVNLEL